jgi:flagellar hook-length control protein FliK
VTIVRQETYLPPVARLSPFQQVVEPIRLAATELAATRTQSAPDLDPGKPAEIAAPTKVLHLELRPVELGSLLVKMRLTQGGMEIRIEASSAETARMLANDKEALREVVRASGFPVDAVSIETVHIDGLSADRQASGQDTNRNDQPDQRQGRGFDQSRQGEQQQEPRRRGWTPEASNREDVHDPDQAGRSGRDAHRYL